MSTNNQILTTTGTRGIKKILNRISLVLILLSLLSAGLAAADGYQYMEAGELKFRLDTGEPTILVDIQDKNSYQEHHLYSATPTYAYPARSEEDLGKLDKVVEDCRQNPGDIVILGLRGGRASQRTHDYLVSRGIPAGRIHILQGGLKEWPFQDMVFNTKGGCG
jgi:rhodanese-related sulfurtransferase